MAMVFAWIKNQRRKKLLSEPFPGGWRTFLHANVRHYQHLDARQRMAVEQVVEDRYRLSAAAATFTGPSLARVKGAATAHPKH